jgi:hypothetical protein
VDVEAALPTVSKQFLGVLERHNEHTVAGEDMMRKFSSVSRLHYRESIGSRRARLNCSGCCKEMLFISLLCSKSEVEPK